MKNWKKWTGLMMAAMMAFSLGACGKDNSTQENAQKKDEKQEDARQEETKDGKEEESGSGEASPSGETVDIAALINTDGLAVWYADKKGYFKELGLDTNITYFVNGTLENEALAAGEAQIGFNGFAGVYSLATGDYTMVADCDDGKGLAV